MTAIRKNFIFNLTSQLLIVILPVVAIPYLSRVLGETNIGIFDYTHSVLNYFILFGCVGMSLYGQREIAFYKNDIFKRSAVFDELLIIRFITIGISTVAYFVYSANFTDYPVYYYLFGIELIASFFDISWFFNGIEDFKLQAVRNVAVKLISIAGVFLFVKDSEDLKLYILFYSAAIFAGNISLWPRLRNEVKYVSVKGLNPVRHIRSLLLMFLPQIATSVYTQLDKTMIGVLTAYNYSEVTYYSQAEKIVKIALTVITSVGAVMLSRVANMFAENDLDKIRAYISKSFKFMFFLGLPITAGLMAVADDFVPVFFGEGYDNVVPCMIALSPLVVIIGISNCLGTQYLLPTNQINKYTASVVVGMLCNAALNFILIPRYAAIGAVAATLVAETLVSAVQFCFVRKNISARVLFFGIKNMICAVLMYICVFFAAKAMPATLPGVAAEVILGCAVYFIALWLIRDSFFLGLIESMMPTPLKRYFSWLYKTSFKNHS